MISKLFISIAALATLASCSLLAPKKEVAHHCKPAGCEEPSTKHTDAGKNRPNPNPITDPIPVQNRIEALEELARNNPKAAHDLALKYFRGEGVTQNSYTSLKWMRYAGERGQLEAQKALGLLYLTGLKEIRGNPAEAEKWLKMAQSSGDEESAALVMEAKRAKQPNKQKWKNEQYWRTNAQRHWLKDYPYLGRWENNRWMY